VKLFLHSPSKIMVFTGITLLTFRHKLFNSPLEGGIHSLGKYDSHSVIICVFLSMPIGFRSCFTQDLIFFCLVLHEICRSIALPF
jgi:hypothetical protein